MHTRRILCRVSGLVLVVKKRQTKVPHYETKPRQFEASNHSLSHERANKWAQRSTQAKRAVLNKQMSEQWEQTSKRTSEWPSTPICIVCYSGPQWNGMWIAWQVNCGKWQVADSKPWEVSCLNGGWQSRPSLTAQTDKSDCDLRHFKIWFYFCGKKSLILSGRLCSLVQPFDYLFDKYRAGTSAVTSLQR